MLWDAYQLSHWLNEIGLSEVSAILLKQMVDGAVLASAVQSMQELHDLGVEKLGQRKRLAKEFEVLSFYPSAADNCNFQRCISNYNDLSLNASSDTSLLLLRKGLLVAA